jgi:hypothetical protein
MAAGIWHDAMAPILTDAPMVPFPPPDPVLAGSTVSADPPPAAAAAHDADGDTPAYDDGDTGDTDTPADDDGDTGD